MFFYELHEGDNDVFTDVLVVSESEWEPDEFFELVQTIRRRIQDSFIHDTLSEAIAVELERDHGFVYVSDDRIVAAVAVSTDDAENVLISRSTPSSPSSTRAAASTDHLENRISNTSPSRTR